MVAGYAKLQLNVRDNLTLAIQFTNLHGKGSISRGYSRPELYLAFRHCPSWFIFFENSFYQKQSNYLMNKGLAHTRRALL